MSIILRAVPTRARAHRHAFFAASAAVLLAAGLASTVRTAAAAAPAKDVDPSLYSSLQWRNIGPNLGGRSLAVAGSVARPNEYYFGATGGGLWKTTNGGTSWAPVTDHQISSSSVGAVAVCAADPDVVYMGMGEVDLRGDVIPGDGVYKTADGGKTWTHLGLADTQMIGKIRIDPTDCNRAYVAALGHAFGPNIERGVFRTTDGGASWQRVLYRDDRTGAVDLSMDLSNPNVLYAAMWQASRKFWLLDDGGPGSGLFKSTDGGTTWTELTDHLGLPAGPVGKIGVSVSGADPNRVYALVEANGGGLFRSDDGGATWALVSTDADIRQRGFYFSKVFADSTNADRVYIGNVSFLRSYNGGATFSTVGTPHSDNHDLWIDPTDNQRMIESNDGGAAVSTNGGSSFTAETYPTGQFYQVVTTNNDPYLVCGEQQDRNSLCVSSTGGTGSFGIGGGESGPVAVDPRDSNVFYAGNYDWLLTRLDRSGNSAIGSRNVNPWPDNPMGYPAAALKHRMQWTFPLVTSPAEPDAVFTGSQYVMKSTNGGQSWQQISPDLSYNDPATTGDSGGPITKDQTSIEYYATVFSIAPSTVNKNWIWAGSDDGKVWFTNKGGGTWHQVTPSGLAKFTRVSMIDAGHATPGTTSEKAQETAYVAAQRYELDDFTPIAYRTHDGGEHWTKITNGIGPNDYLWTIRQDPQRSDLLYATSAHGAYVSFNDGDSWQSLRLNLPDTTVYDLKVKGDDLVVSTHGRGFYVLDDGAALFRRLTPNTKPADIADFHQTVPTPTPVTVVNPPPAVIPPTTPAPDANNDVATLRDPNNVVRSVSGNVSVNYTLKVVPTSATMTILDQNGNTAFTATLPTTASTRNQTWNLRYPNAVSFPGLIYWAGTNTGPKAPTGTYTVRLTVDGQTLEQSFDDLKDARLTNVTAADIATQFALDLNVRNKTNDANQDVINVRACTAQVDARVTADPSLVQAGAALDDKLNAVQNELYQTKLQAGEDPLNFPIKLNDKIGALHGVIESVDGKPTDQTYQVFDELNALLQVQLQKLRDIVSTDVAAFNQLLQDPISCAAI
jgi:photosystem II stability/assembly factor-like uncharacterized protein